MKPVQLIAAVALLGGTAAAQPGPDTPPYDPAAPPPPEAMPPGPYGQPAPMPPQPGGARATFMSTTEKRWDVRIDQNAACTTPCALYIEPGRFVTLHSQDPHPQKLSIGYLPAGDLMVQARPRADGAFATAVTFTSLGGAAVVTGITLAAVGCNTDNGTMCRAGVITGLSGAVALGVFIPMIKRSLPKATIGPATGQPYTNGQTVGLSGTF